MRAFRSARVIAGLALFFAAPPARAAEEAPPTVLPEVLVTEKTDTLTVPSLATARAQIAEVPGGASVIDTESVKKARAATLLDALGYAPGVFVQPRFGSEESRLSIRGSGLQRTFHLRGIKLLQDGVPLSQADGGGDFQAVEPLAARYIEIRRGANALRHGATTLGGAVNFVSPTGRDAPLAQARFEAGSFDYLRSQFSSGASSGPLDYFVSASHFAQQGFRAHSEQNNKRLFSNAGARLGENLETRFYLTALNTHSNLPGNLTKAQLRENPRQGAAANIANNQKRDFDLVRLASKTTWQSGGHRFDGSVFWTYKDLFHPIFQVLDVVSDDIGFETRYTHEGELGGNTNRLTVGFVPVWGFNQDDRFVNSGGNRGLRTGEVKQRAYNLDCYAEDQLYVLPRLAVVAGTQLTYAVRKADDLFLSNGDNSGRQVFHGFSPKAGLLYDLTPRTKLYGNISRSFEPPSFGELANIAAGGLLRLDPQRATTVEAGSRGAEGRFEWDASYYHAWVSDELLALNDGAGNPLGTVNATDTTHHGIELAAAVTVLEGLWAEPEGDRAGDRVLARGNYLWSRFAFDEDPVYSDNHLPGIPGHLLRAECLYEHPLGFYAGPNLEWTFKESPADLANTLFADPYALLGFKAGFRGAKGFSVFLEGRNLTDKTYAATTGVIADARGLDSAQFLPGDGRSFVGGVEWRW